VARPVCPSWCTHHVGYRFDGAGMHRSSVGMGKMFLDGATRPTTLRVGTRQYEDTAGREPRRIFLRLGREGRDVQFTAGQAEALAALLLEAAEAVRHG
jgi:hypothetical protein